MDCIAAIKDKNDHHLQTQLNHLPEGVALFNNESTVKFVVLKMFIIPRVDVVGCTKGRLRQVVLRGRATRLETSITHNTTLTYARPVYWDFKYNLFIRIFNFFLIACVLNRPLSFFFP